MRLLPPLAAVLSAVVLGGSLGWPQAQPAFACSPPPDFDYWGNADVVVEGLVLDTSPDSSVPEYYWKATMNVARVVRGELSTNPLVFYDTQSSACGAAASKGAFYRLGLKRGPDGRLRATWMAGHRFSDGDFLTSYPTPTDVLVTPNSPYEEGLNAVVIKKLTVHGTPAAAMRWIEADARGQVRAIWVWTGGRWFFYLPERPVQTTLTVLPETSAAFVILQQTATMLPQPFP